MGAKRMERPVGPDTTTVRLREASRGEAYARKLDIRCVAVGRGSCRVELRITDELLNLFGMAHGGAVFSLIDEAFQVACNSHGVTAFALNVNVTYVRGVTSGTLLTAEATEVALTRKTGTYAIRVADDAGETVALAQAVAYRKGVPLPFLDVGDGTPPT